MNKIPVQQQESPAPPAQPGYLPDALQTLLLGGIWWFVLIWLPLLLAENAAPELGATVIRAYGVAGRTGKRLDTSIDDLRAAQQVQRPAFAGLHHVGVFGGAHQEPRLAHQQRGQEQGQGEDEAVAHHARQRQ